MYSGCWHAAGNLGTQLSLSKHVIYGVIDVKGLGHSWYDGSRCAAKGTFMRTLCQKIFYLKSIYKMHILSFFIRKLSSISIKMPIQSAEIFKMSLNILLYIWKGIFCKYCRPTTLNVSIWAKKRSLTLSPPNI